MRAPTSPFHAAVHASTRGYALMSYPTPPPEEVQGVAYLAAVLPHLTAPVRVRHPFIDMEMELPKDIGPRIFYLASVGAYELSDLELLQRHVKAGDDVMEVGGGIGLTAALSAKISGRPVTVVEPDSRLFPIIRRQVEIANGEVRFLHAAVSAAEDLDEVDLFLDDEVWLSSLTEQDPARGERNRTKVRVPHRPLSELFDEHRPSAVMIDIEGAEEGLFERPYRHLPERLLVEVHFPLLGEQRAMRVTQSILDLGYRHLDCYGWTFVFQRK
ncbi:MAG: FkbM family methyltransferase [Polyangiaceae bacterium]